MVYEGRASRRHREVEVGGGGTRQKGRCQVRGNPASAGSFKEFWSIIVPEHLSQLGAGNWAFILLH